MNDLPIAPISRPTLEGERLILRPTEEADYIHGYRWEQDAEVQHWAQGDYAPSDLTFAQYKSHYAPPIGKSGEGESFTIIARPDTIIGFIGYFNANRRIGKVEVGIGIGEKAYWGSGYGRDAMRLLLAYLVERLGYQRVELDTWSGNERAIRAYQACGFQIEGRLRRGELVDGAYYDTILMGLLREEWDALRLIAHTGR
jgi:RimJ/RimL family protein N-acetyltransferase